MNCSNGPGMLKYVIPGSNDRKSDASLLAGGFLNLGPAKNMSKKPFFRRKNERITNVFEDCGSTQCGAIRGIGVSIEKRSEGLSQESAADPHL